MKSRPFSTVLLFCVGTILCLGGVLGFVPQAMTLGQAPAATIAPNHGRPLVNLRNPQSLKVEYDGSADAVSALKAGATATNMAVGDFDADGAPDLVSGYKAGDSGVVTLQRGNPDAFAPKDPTLYPAATRGMVAPTFLSKATAFAVPESPDFLAVGDFNRDGNRDLLVGTNGGGLYLLAGDGKGKLGAPQAVPLSGAVRTMDVSDGGYVAVSLEGSVGLRVAILAPSTHGLTEVGSYPTPAPATSLAWGSLGGGLDLAVGAGNNVMMIYAPLGSNPETETVTLPVSVQALAVGDYIWDRDGRQEIAVLGGDGTVRILQHGTLDTRPLTSADIPGRRALLHARPSEMPSPMAMGPWTVAKQLPATGATPAGPASRSTFSSPRLATASTHDLMLLDAGKNQVTLLDTSGKAENATATIAFSGTPVAAVALPQKINAGRDLVVLTSSAVEPIVTEDAPDPTFNVNTTADIDSVGACAQNSTVTSSAGTLSLREAVCEANNSGAASSVINLPAGTYDLAISTFGGNDSASSSPELQVGIQSGNNITISGAGAGSTIIQQTASGSRIIEADEELAGNEPLAVQNLSLQLGNCTDSGLDCLDNGGGAILAGGATGDTLTITSVTFNDNKTQSGAGTLGGAVQYTGSLLSITGSTFSQNTASGTGGAQGGALQVEDVINGSEVSGSVTITNSSFTGNSAISGNNGNANGGGLYFEGGASFNASVTGSTFTGNTASSTASTGAATGGGIDAGGGASTFSLSNSRIVGNSVSASSAVASGYYAVGLTNTLTNNWWGCNGGPGASGCDTVVFDFASGGSGTFNPWLVLSITAGSTQVDASGTTGLTADLTHNSAAAGGFSVPTGTPVTFGGTLDSGVNPSSTTLTSGTATSTYTAGSTAGAGSGTATVDNQTASVTIDVLGGTSTLAAVDDAGTGSAWSGTETAGASAYATASVTPSGSGPTPTGNLTYVFYLGSTCTSTTVGTSTVTLSGGSAPRSTTVGPLGAGTYSLSASYAGDSYHAGSSSTCSSFIVNKVQPAVTVTPGQSRINSAQPLSVTVSVTGGSGNPTPTGSVTLTSGSYNSGATALTAGSASITIPAGQLAVGSDTLTGTYSGDTTYTTAIGTAPVTVVQAIGSCTTANPNPNPNPESFAAVADFNGDCKSDILWRNTGNQEVYEWFMNGTTYTGGGSPGTPTSDWVIQGAGDFDGDGKADILWRNTTTGEVYVWLMNGTTIASSGSLGFVSSDWSIAGVGDFNGDGKADILWWNSSTAQVYLWLMNGTTVSGGGAITSVSSGWNIAGVGDFDGDGKADVLWRNSSTGQTYVWLMNGTTIASSGSPGASTSDWVIQGVGDFDGNGKSDILWRNTTTGQVYLWFINGTTTASSGAVTSVSSEWVIQGVGDYDGSGRAGVLWRNTSTQQVYVWLMNGATITGQGSPGDPAAGWQIAP